MIKSYSFRPKIGNYVGKNVCIFDEGGTCVELARILSDHFVKTFYYTEWKQTGFPQINRWAIGQCIPNVIRVDDFFSIINDVDLFIFTDVLRSDLQKYLISKGKLVWGARDGEIIEQERHELKKLLLNVGLPVGKFDTIIGTKNLREYLKENEDVYVKIDKFRGTSETFHSENYDTIEPLIDELDTKLGPCLKNTIPFLVEQSIPTGVETGMDIFVCDGKFPDRTMGGIEAKNASYLCKVLPYAEFPKQLRIVNDSLVPFFKKVGYRGAFSTEIRITKDGVPYFMDATCRQPLPPSQLQWYMYKNLPDILWETASGNIIDCEIDEPFGCQLILTSDQCKKGWLSVNCPPEYRENVFWDRYMMDGDKTYITYDPDNKYVGSVVATGWYLDQAIEKAEEIAKSLSGIGIMYDDDSVEELKEQIKEMQKLGVNFF